MSRRHHLVIYDIRDSNRLRRVHETVLSYGYMVQYSVYLCDLSPRELVLLKRDVTEVMHVPEDSVAIVDLGESSTKLSDRIEFLGQRPILPGPGPMVV